MLFYTPFWNLIIQSLKDVILYLYSHQSVVDNSLRRLRRRGAALYIDCYIILLYCRQSVVDNSLRRLRRRGGRLFILIVILYYCIPPHPHREMALLLIYYYGGDKLHDSHIFTKHIILSLEDTHLHTF